MDNQLPFAKPNSTRRNTLGGFLRSVRERLKPAEIGINPGSRRRAKGLLREEVAQEAGISLTWYTWIEQGRDVRASPRALNGLARALRLDAAERDYIFRLARPDLQKSITASKPAMPSEALKAFIRSLSPLPAYVLDVRWDIVFANPESVKLIGKIDPEDKFSRNLIARMFTRPEMRERFVEWEIVAKSSVAQFRNSTPELAGDTEHQNLVEALIEREPIFRDIWNKHGLAGSPNWTKAFNLPGKGLRSYRYNSFRPIGVDSPFMVTIYSPV